MDVQGREEAIRLTTSIQAKYQVCCVAGKGSKRAEVTKATGVRGNRPLVNIL